MGIETSFNFQGYRDNLAKDLKKERNENGEEAGREKLKDVQQTSQYQVSKMLKLIKKEVENYPGTTVEQNQLEIEQYDISEQIPEALKLCADIRRIAAIEKKAGKKLLPPLVRNTLPDVADLRSLLIEELKKRKLNIEDKDTRLMDQLERDLIFDVVNEITDGAFASENYISHAIYAYSNQEIYDSRVAEWVAGREDQIFNATKYGLNFDPHSLIVGVDRNSPKQKKLRQEHPYIFFRQEPISTTKEIFFSRSIYKATYSRADSVILIADPQSERFKKFTIEADVQDDQAEAAYMIPVNTSWLEISDYIVDLLGGKMYKVTELEKDSKSTNNHSKSFNPNTSR